ncbi:hypothetical protein [Acinetobacter silvestris]|nr:hypothetical protein [Acinetobacter silvestris]
MKEHFITYLGFIGITITIITGWYKEIASSGLLQHLSFILSFKRLRIRHKIQDIDLICDKSDLSEAVKSNLKYEQRQLYLQYYYGLNIQDNEFYEYMTGYKDKKRAFGLYKNGGKYLKYNKNLKTIDFESVKQKERINIYRNIGLVIYIFISFLSLLYVFWARNFIILNKSDYSPIEKISIVLVVNVIVPIVIVVIGAWILNKFLKRLHAQKLIELERISQPIST